MTKRSFAIGKAIQEARQNKSYTQRTLADAAGISLKGLQQIERGESDPRVSTLEKLCKALGIRLAHLFDCAHEYIPNIPGLPNEAWLKAFNSLNVPIEIIDFQGKYLYQNQASIRFRDGDVLEQNLYVWNLIPQESQKGFKDYFDYLITNVPDPTPYHGVTLRAKNGYALVRVDWQYTLDSAGRPNGFVCVISESN